MLERALGFFARPAALCCLLAPAGLAQGSTLVQTLTGQQIGDLFGTASAVSGDRAAVRNSGRIDLFERSNGLWSPLQSIPIDNPEGGAGLGLPLYLGPDFLAVGLPYGIVGGINSGLVRIYRPTPSGYQLEQTLLPEQPLIGAFGWSMAREGQRLAVGAPFYQQGFQSHGAVFVFETGPGTWPQAQAIRASDSKNQDNFGFSIDIEGDRLVAGARLHDAGTSNSGAVYVFERQGGAWVQIQKLLSPEPVIGGEFGRSLALDGGTLVVGSLRAETGNGLKSGAAFLFTQTPEGYQLDSKLVQAIPGDGDGFGVSVALNGPLLAVGACYHDGAGQDDGAVYLYEQVAGWWIERNRYLDPSSTSASLAGWTTALAGDQIFTGSLVDYGSSSQDPGLVRVHQIPAAPKCGAVPYALVAENPLQLLASPVKPGQLFFATLLSQGLPAAQIWLSTAAAKLALPFGSLAIDLSNALLLPTIPFFGNHAAAVPVPSSPALAGQSFYLQGFGLSADPSAWRLSHGLRLTACP